MGGRNATDLDEVASSRAPAPDRVAVAYGVGWFIVVLLIAYGLWLAEFRVGDTFKAGVACAGFAGWLAWSRWGTPRSKLAPARRAARSYRGLCGFVGGSLAVLVLVSYVAAHQLRSWSQWIVLANLVLCTIGVALAVNGHLFFRKR